MLHIKNTKTNPIPALPLLQFNVENNKKKNPSFVYDDDDIQGKQRQQ